MLHIRTPDNTPSEASQLQTMTGSLTTKCQETKKNLTESIVLMDQEIKHSPGDDRLYLQRGRLYWQTGNLPACFADYDEAIRLNPQSPAKQLKAIILNIMAYRCKDLYNP